VHRWFPRHPLMNRRLPRHPLRRMNRTPAIRKCNKKKARIAGLFSIDRSFGLK
jgi:hypothetical protein